jgi:protocatechuate 3,4-dioxygenase, alpha subunit
MTDTSIQSPAAGETPSQTVGPYFTMALADGTTADLRAASHASATQFVLIHGSVMDGNGTHVEDALIEVWQANEHGRYAHPADQRTELPLTSGFAGYGRVTSEFRDGTFTIRTIKPGRVPDSQGGWQAPHLNVIVQARGMLLPQFTRCYFGDDDTLLETDCVLASLTEAQRDTVIAIRLLEGDGSADNPARYGFTIWLQGDQETVFFDV